MRRRPPREADRRPDRASSIRTRIVWITAMVTVAAMAAMILAVILVVAHVTQGRVNASLKDRIAATEAATTRAGDGGLQVTNTAANEVIDSVWVFDSDGTQVSGPRAGSRVQSTVEGLSRVTRKTRVVLGDRVYLAEPIRLRGERRASGVAVAEQSTRPYEDTQTVLLGGLVVLGVLVSGVTATITAWTVRRTLRPVQRMTELAAEWNDQNLDSRFRLGPGTDEFSQLGNTLDALLDRVAEALRNEQQLTAELAHELRTPLTTIRAEAELGTLSDVDDATRERLQRVMAQVDRLDRTITTLLALARHQQGRHGPPTSAPSCPDSSSPWSARTDRPCPSPSASSPGPSPGPSASAAARTSWSASSRRSWTTPCVTRGPRCGSRSGGRGATCCSGSATTDPASTPSTRTTCSSPAWGIPRRAGRVWDFRCHGGSPPV